MGEAVPEAAQAARRREAVEAEEPVSVFDRPVSRVVYGQNPWPFARELQELGCEVIESDLVPPDQLIVVDLDALDRMREEMLERVGESLRFDR